MSGLRGRVATGRRIRWSVRSGRTDGGWPGRRRPRRDRLISPDRASRRPYDECPARSPPEWEDIVENYPQTARTSLNALVAVRSPTGTGKLIPWHGPPGTGKTTALRSLMRSWSRWCQPRYIADPEKFFTEPAYMTQVLTTAPVAKVGPSLRRAGQPEAVWRLLVAEDSDEYLRASARRDAGLPSGDCSTWPTASLAKA